MALQVDQVDIKTIAPLYTMKRERNLELQRNDDVTPTLKSSWRWTGAELRRTPTGHWKSDLDKFNCLL